MKKSIIAVAMLLLSLTISAQDYTHSIGGMVGSMYGVTYKGFIFGIDGLALQADLGVNLFSLAGKAEVKTDGVKNTSDIRNGAFFTFVANPNIVYQQNIASWNFGSLSWFAGGGISLGLMQQYGNMEIKDDNGDWNTVSVSDWKNANNGKDQIYGKFGINALAGLELGFSSVPLALGLDFRPGYGVGFRNQKVNGVKTEQVVNFFDWSLAASLRYCF